MNRPLFKSDRFYDQPAIAGATGRSTRTVRNWRVRGLLPPPDVLLGGKDPAWTGDTLNASAAFESPEAA